MKISSLLHETPYRLDSWVNDLEGTDCLRRRKNSVLNDFLYNDEGKPQCKLKCIVFTKKTTETKHKHEFTNSLWEIP